MAWRSAVFPSLRSSLVRIVFLVPQFFCPHKLTYRRAHSVFSCSFSPFSSLPLAILIYVPSLFGLFLALLLLATFVAACCASSDACFFQPLFLFSSPSSPCCASLKMQILQSNPTFLLFFPQHQSAQLLSPVPPVLLFCSPSPPPHKEILLSYWLMISGLARRKPPGIPVIGFSKRFSYLRERHSQDPAQPSPVLPVFHYSRAYGDVDELTGPMAEQCPFFRALDLLNPIGASYGRIIPPNHLTTYFPFLSWSFSSNFEPALDQFSPHLLTLLADFVSFPSFLLPFFFPPSEYSFLTAFSPGRRSTSSLSLNVCDDHLYGSMDKILFASVCVSPDRISFPPFLPLGRKVLCQTQKPACFLFSQFLSQESPRFSLTRREMHWVSTFPAVFFPLLLSSISAPSFRKFSNPLFTKFLRRAFLCK